MLPSAIGLICCLCRGEQPGLDTSGADSGCAACRERALYSLIGGQQGDLSSSDIGTPSRSSSCPSPRSGSSPPPPSIAAAAAAARRAATVREEARIGPSTPSNRPTGMPPRASAGRTEAPHAVAAAPDPPHDRAARALEPGSPAHRGTPVRTAARRLAALAQQHAQGHLSDAAFVDKARAALLIHGGDGGGDGSATCTCPCTVQ